jgi:hypothetical protein
MLVQGQAGHGPVPSRMVVYLNDYGSN